MIILIECFFQYNIFIYFDLNKKLKIEKFNIIFNIIFLFFFQFYNKL